MKYNKQEEQILLDGIASGKSYEEIAKEILEKTGRKRNAESVRSKYRNMRRKDHTLEPVLTNSQNSVSAVIDEEVPKYTVKNDVVTWKYRHGVIELNLKDLDEIFYEYSRHGLNLSQVKVQNRHGFTAIQWQSLKRTFDLVKDSDVFSPYSLSLVSEKEACDMIAEKIAEKYSPKNMRAVIEYEDDKQRRNAYNKAIKTVSRLDYRRRTFETELLDFLATQPKVIEVRKSKDKKINHAVITVQDLHVGANIAETKTLPKFDADIVAKRLDEAVREINQRGASKNTICINGDIIETFTGLNHINSWKNIDKSYGYGVQATIKAIELLTDFFQKVNNVHEVLIVAGNHDRTTSSNKEDVTGEVIQWIHYVLKERFSKAFPVEWSADVISRTVNDVCYVWTHGHLGLSNKPVAEIVNRFGDPARFTLVIEGHLHTRKVKADGAKFRSIVGSSIFTGNDYSSNLGFSTLPGFLYCHGNIYPTVIDIPLSTL